MQIQVPSLSFWEQQWLKNADILIIGSGIVGLQCARQLKKKWPHREVWVIDRAPVSFGASTRNAGFACFGSVGEILDDISRTDRETALALYERRFRGLHLLLQDFGDQAIGYEKTGGYEIFEPAATAELENVLAHTESISADLKDITGEIPFTAKNTARLGMNILETGIYTPLEGMIQSHLLYKRIYDAAIAAGVVIYGGLTARTPVQQESGRWRVGTEEGYGFDARMLVLCTNGFTRQLMPDMAVEPARGQVLVTSAIPDLAWRGLMHADQGYIYFRSLGTRILIGGARNLDLEGEATMSMNNTEAITSRLISFLKETVVPGAEFTIDYQWAGIMGMHRDRTPIVRRLAPGLLACVRMGGMGVALSALVSRELADLAGEE